VLYTVIVIIWANKLQMKYHKLNLKQQVQMNCYNFYMFIIV